MLARTWHGWTTPEAADAYEDLLRGEVFPGIRARCGDGLSRIDLLRRPLGQEIEFMTILWFRDQASLDRLAGEGGEAAYVPPPARAILRRFDERASLRAAAPPGMSRSPA
jgi:hypothetical protein